MSVPVTVLPILDTHLYTANLDCIDHHSSVIGLECAHAPGRFVQGGHLLPPLDSVILRLPMKQRTDATDKLLHLAPCGLGAAAVASRPGAGRCCALKVAWLSLRHGPICWSVLRQATLFLAPLPRRGSMATDKILDY